MRRAGVTRKSKIVAGISVLLALLLSVTWFLVTSGINSGTPLIDVPPGARGETHMDRPAPHLASPTMFIA